jgi:hypothetical protein
VKLQMDTISKIILSVLLAAGCTSERKSQDTYRVQIPWPDDAGNYSLQSIQLDTLADSSSMQGAAATMKVGRGLRGPHPTAQFIEDADGTLIPSDFNTLQMAVVYAHLEKLMYLEKSLGFGDLLPRPRKVTIEYAMNEGAQNLYDNALYYPAWDSLIILPYRRREIPISMNAGILAHEHFHAIFQHTMGQASMNGRSPMADNPWLEKEMSECGQRMETNVFFKANGEKNPTVVSQVLMRAMNEGLADFWGWLYTGDESFIGKSISKAGIERKVHSSFKPLPGEKFFEALGKVQDVSVLMDTSYCLGTQYARFMRRLAEIYGKDKIGRRLLSSLKASKGQRDMVVDPALIGRMFFRGVKLEASECEAAKLFFGEHAVEKLQWGCPIQEPEKP